MAVVNSKLLSNYIHWRQMITDNLRCELCQEGEEMNLHVVRDCPKEKKVWLHFIPPNFINSSLPLKD